MKSFSYNDIIVLGHYFGGFYKEFTLDNCDLCISFSIVNISLTNKLV